jgi:mannose-1-phosphate guanylyltransferase/mannose-6-phosphate isomerase
VKQTIQPIVLCGGSGSKLWPVSRTQEPKQFVPLLNDRSLIQETVARLSVISDTLPPLFICHQQYEALLRSHLGILDIHQPTIIFEPEQKNTGPCIAMAAKWTQEHHPEAIMAIFPADHYVEDDQEFAKVIKVAVQVAQLGGIVCLGVVPDYPATGFGYIKKGEIKLQSMKVAAFVEKPNAQVAKEFVDSGDYLWNSGIFIASAKQMLVEIARHSPEISRYALKALEQARVSERTYYVAPQQYSQCPSVPFDIAVMEQTDRAEVIPYVGVWSDLGTWESILAHSIIDEDGNSTKGDVYHNKCENSLLWGHTRPLVVIGMENVVVIDTPDATLVSSRECIQEVKSMVEKVSASQPVQVDKVALSDRPWGSFEVLESTEGYKVKRLTVKPGGKLSLQRHRFRSESWTVVAGQAWVTCDSTVKKLEVGESAYIAQGSIHRLENKASLTLVVMEVQFGSYLEEDDIERLEDIYDRKCS